MCRIRNILLIQCIVGTLFLAGSAMGAQRGVPQGDHSGGVPPLLEEHIQSSRLDLSQFDEDVVGCRREMRKYCAIVQQLMKRSRPHINRRAQALEHLKKAKEQWQIICSVYQDNPPMEYAIDPKFQTRMQDIASIMDDMQGHLEAGHFKKSFWACAFACGQFVAMHEDNNLTYAVDRIFHPLSAYNDWTLTP